MRQLTIISIILTFLIFILELNYPHQYFLQFLTGVINIFLTWYLISVLQLAGEQVSIQTPFSIFLGVQIIMLFSNLLSAGASLTSFFPDLEIILIIYIILMVFSVKNVLFASAFKTYGILLLIVLAFKTFILFEWKFPLASGSSFYLAYNDLLKALPLFAILSIINKTNKALHQDLPPANDQVIS